MRSFLGGRGAVRAAAELVPMAWMRRASTTRRTNTAKLGLGSDGCSISTCGGGLTSKRLFDVDHLPGTRLHEAALVGAGPFQALLALDLAPRLQVALVAGDDLDGGHGAVVQALVGLHVDHLHEVLEGLEALRVGDVIDQQESVAAQVAGGPQAAVLLLAGRVRQRQVVRLAVDCARHAVRVLDGRVIVVRPGAADQAQGYRRFTCTTDHVLAAIELVRAGAAARLDGPWGRRTAAAVAADGDGYPVVVLHCGG